VSPTTTGRPAPSYLTYAVPYTAIYDHPAQVAGIIQGPQGVYFDGEGFVYTGFGEPCDPFGPDWEIRAGHGWGALEAAALEAFSHLDFNRNLALGYRAFPRHWTYSLDWENEVTGVQRDRLTVLTDGEAAYVVVDPPRFGEEPLPAEEIHPLVLTFLTKLAQDALLSHRCARELLATSASEEAKR
jgi:hypothetical protein